MKGFVYLIKNGDLYGIGHVKNIDSLKRDLKPDQIIQSLYLDHPESLEVRLYRRYKNVRLPGSGYFKLSPSQLRDCKKQLGKKGNIPRSLAAEFSISLTGSTVIFFAVFFVLNYFKVPYLNRTSFSLLVSSIPFWLLLFSGNFGGYETNDLPLFSSWANRAKALLAAALITLAAYFIFVWSMRLSL